MEQMPMWCPPTPPTSDNDVYVDYTLGFLYESTPLSETQLPPVYVKKEPKRSRTDVTSNDRDVRRPMKIRHKDESVFAPRSLFDRPSPALIKMRRDLKLHKHRGMVRPIAPMPGVKPTSMVKSTLEQEQVLDWMVHEDWALLQAIQVYQGLPLNLVIISPGHTPNWDLVADIVNNTSRIYRSPKQCRTRYETVIVPREEGKLLYETTPKKQKKQKGVYKMPQVAEQQSKTNRPMRTCQLYNQDKNNSFTLMCCGRFDTIKAVSNKRTPTVKPLLVNPMMKNPKHAAVLGEYGIQYESPLTPIDVATRRHERIEREKQKNAANRVLAPEQQQQVTAARLVQQAQLQPQVQVLQSQGQQIPINPSPQQQQVVIATAQASQPHQLTPIVASVTTVASVTVKTTPPTNTIVTSGATNVTSVKARQANALSMQDVRAHSATVSLTNYQAAQRIAAANLVSASQNAAGVTRKPLGVTLNPASGARLSNAQMQALQHANLRQQQLKAALQAQAASGQKGLVAVTGTAPQRATVMKQGVATGSPMPSSGSKQTIARTLTEADMATFIKRQPLLQQQGKTVAQGQTAQSLAVANIFAQAGLQVQQASTSTSGTPVATLVKTGPVVGVRTTTPQHIRQLQSHQLVNQRKLQGHKVTQMAGKGGIQTQLIVQTQPKLNPSALTVQQFQQVMKHVQPGNMQQFAHVSTAQGVSQAGQVVLAKSQMSRMIPVTVASGGLKQTIQVVSATSSTQLRQSTPPHGKPIVTTARGSPGPSQVRLQTIAHTVHQQTTAAQQQTTQPNQQDPSTK